MTLNPFSIAAKAFYHPFKKAILAAWNAAKTDALAEIQASLPTDADFAQVGETLQQLRGEQQPAIATTAPAIEDATAGDEPTRRKGSKK